MKIGVEILDVSGICERQQSSQSKHENTEQEGEEGMVEIEIDEVMFDKFFRFCAQILNLYILLFKNSRFIPKKARKSGSQPLPFIEGFAQFDLN